MWFLELGTPEGIFAAAYSVATMNLACRGDSTGQICTKHLKWAGDAVGVAFSHSKEEQMGDDPRKRLPRHCYPNPFNQDADFFSAVFNYLAMFPEVLSEPDGLLFPGSAESQTDRFSRVLKQVVKDKATVIQRQYTFNPEDIGVHSWRKCAHTKLNCGSTSGPTSAASCLRGGHSLGGSKNVYVVQEKASDEYCGRILSDLDENSAKFAVSYPDFIPIDLERSICGGVSDSDYNNRKKEVDADVAKALDEIFGKDNLDGFPTIVRFLVIGLASHLTHREKIDELLPSDSKFRFTPVFTSLSVLTLKQHVRHALPWEDHTEYFTKATGLPPHVINFKYYEKLDAKLDKLPQLWEKSLDDRQFNGNISLTQMRSLIKEDESFKAMARDVATMKRAIEGGGFGTGGNNNNNTSQPGDVIRRGLYNHHGKWRRVPPGWKFPHLSLQNMYQFWHCGDDQSAQKVLPMKHFDSKDMSYLGRRDQINLTNVRFLMGLIDKTAEVKGRPPKATMTRVEANACFFVGQAGIDVNAKTPTGRLRIKGKLTWSSVLRLMNNSNKKKKS